VTIKVAINGFGTIGKRVADAVAAQPDMVVAGVTKTRPTSEAWLAASRGYPLFGVSTDHAAALSEAGLKVAGALPQLLQGADVVVDCSPGKMGVTNLPAYAAAGVKVVLQGGEKHQSAGLSFNAAANYHKAVGATKARVVSCNTTGLIRTLHPLREAFGIDHVHAVMVRRGADPADTDSGPINAIEPVLRIPSHHGPDVATVMEGLSISTLAMAVPTTLMHLHAVAVQLTRPPTSAAEVLAQWGRQRRILFVEGAKGVTSTAQVMELAKDMGRPRSDLQQVAVWRDGVSLVGPSLYYYQAIHQESDVVPENVDCIRALSGTVKDGPTSMAMTDTALGLTNGA